VTVAERTSVFLCCCPAETLGRRGRRCSHCDGVVVPPACARALHALRRAGSRGLTGPEFERVGVRFAAARIKDLRTLGFVIHTDRLRSGMRRHVLKWEPPVADVGRTIDRTGAQDEAAAVDGAPGAGTLPLFDAPPAAGPAAGGARSPYAVEAAA
jgi:hypothetical protein